MTFKVNIDVKPGTEPMKKVGILAKVILTLTDENGATVVTLKETNIREGRSGPFVAFPSTKSNKKDAEGKDIYYPIYKLFSEDEAKLQSLKDEILRRGGFTSSGPPAAASYGNIASRPASKPVFTRANLKAPVEAPNASASPPPRPSGDFKDVNW